MPDPYVGWDVFFYNALFWGPIILIWWIVERVKTAKQNRERRKDLGLTAQDVADAAGISRVTLHRIEKGEPSVTMAAYANVMQMVGLPLTVPADVKADADADAALPERNARLLDETNLSHAERRLLELLRREFEVAPRV